MGFGRHQLFEPDSDLAGLQILPFVRVQKLPRCKLMFKADKSGKPALEPKPKQARVR